MKICQYFASLDSGWVQAIAESVAALGTIAALIYAVRSAKQTADFSRQTIEEARSDRKDDVMPALEVASQINQGSDVATTILKNTTDNPLFDFKLVTKIPGIIARASLDGTGHVQYDVNVRYSELPEIKSKDFITYGYKDLYGRRFQVKHYWSTQDSNRPQLLVQTDIPRRISD